MLKALYIMLIFIGAGLVLAIVSFPVVSLAFRLFDRLRTNAMAKLANQLNMSYELACMAPEDYDLPYLDLYHLTKPCRINHTLRLDADPYAIRIMDVYCSGLHIPRHGNADVIIIAINHSCKEIPDFSAIYKDAYLPNLDTQEDATWLRFQHCWNFTNLYLLRSSDPVAIASLITNDFIQCVYDLKHTSIENYDGWLFIHGGTSNVHIRAKDITRQIEAGLELTHKLEAMANRPTSLIMQNTAVTRA